MNKFLYLAGGIAVGGLAGFLIGKKVYDKPPTEIEVYAGRERKEEPGQKVTDELENPSEEANDPALDRKPDIMEYAAKLRGAGYKRDYTSPESAQPKPEPYEEPPVEDIHVIPPEQFGDDDEYDRISLTWYSDGVLADENDMTVSDDDKLFMVGENFEKHFGEYEDDSVYIRNDALKAYFEILADPRRYDDILKSKPYLKEK